MNQSVLIQYSFQTDISVPYGALNAILEWCKKNCKDEWGWHIISPSGEKPGLYKFHFVNEIDQINFILWQK
jgi:hypothetical protein